MKSKVRTVAALGGFSKMMKTNAADKKSTDNDQKRKMSLPPLLNGRNSLGGFARTSTPQNVRTQASVSFSGAVAAPVELPKSIV